MGELQRKESGEEEEGERTRKELHDGALSLERTSALWALREYPRHAGQCEHRIRGDVNLAAFITMSSTHWRPLYYLAILKQYCLEENRNFSFCIQGVRRL